MNWIEITIAEFGMSLGIPALQLGDDNQLRMELAPGELIAIHYLADSPAREVLVSCRRALAWNQPEQLRHALRLVDFRLPTEWPAQVALDEDALVFNLRIPERSFVRNVLEQAIAQLRQMHDRIG